MPKNKDPAVLFYTADFLADTVLWSYEELGRYIKLLCIQHLQDGISDVDFNSVADGNPRISSKFNLDDDGFYRNKRMKDESDRRKEFCEKQRANRLNPKTKEFYLFCPSCSISAIHIYRSICFKTLRQVATSRST